MFFLFLFPLIGYLIGSIPFGLVLVKLIHNEDIRKFGSGNIGATNVWRRGYKFLAILTFLLDAGKAWIAMLICFMIRDNYQTGIDPLISSAGLFAIIGHIYSIFLKGKGGKGVSTFMGYLTIVSPILMIINVILWLTSFKIWRYSSLSAIIMLIATISYSLVSIRNYNYIMILIAASIILWKHKDNIKRLLDNKELKMK